MVDRHESPETLAAKALDFLSTVGVDKTPRAYAVGYAYAERNMKVVRRIENILDRRGRLTLSDCERIYDEAIDAAQPSMITSLQDGIGATLKRSIDALAVHRQTTDTLSSNTAEFIETVTSDADPASIVPSARKFHDEVSTYQTHLATVIEASRLASAELEAKQRQLDELVALANRDQLTGLFNRRGLKDALERDVSSAHRYNTPLTVLVIDIDHFKAFNDNHGHAFGDMVLRVLSEHLRKSLRGSDFAARLGGEEFAIVLPNTEIRGAAEVAERIRSGLAEKRLVRKGTNEEFGGITITIGVAALKKDDKMDDLLNRADMRLYHGKRNGRNTVVSSGQFDMIERNKSCEGESMTDSVQFVI